MTHFKPQMLNQKIWLGAFWSKGVQTHQYSLYLLRTAFEHISEPSNPVLAGIKRAFTRLHSFVPKGVSSQTESYDPEFACVKPISLCPSETSRVQQWQGRLP